MTFINQISYDEIKGRITMGLLGSLDFSSLAGTNQFKNIIGRTVSKPVFGKVREQYYQQRERAKKIASGEQGEYI